MCIKKIFSFFFCTALLCTSLTACGNEDDGSNGIFTVAISENPKNLDPQMATDQSSIFIIRNIYAPLMETNESGLVVCSSAQSYRVSEDSLKYEFTLRDGLYWHTENGDIPLTAEDYVYAFQRIYDSATKSPHTEVFSCIKNSAEVYSGALPPDKLGVYATDEKTVVFELSEPCCDFLKLMSHWAAMPCSEELFLSTKGRYGLSAQTTYGCGAFYVSDWNYDPYWNENYITLERIAANSSDSRQTLPKTVTAAITSDVQEYESRNGIEINAYTIDSLQQLDAKEMKRSSVSEYTAETVCLLISPESQLFSDENGRRAAAIAVYTSDIYSETSDFNIFSSEGCTAAKGILPPACTIMNTPFRDLYSDAAAVTFAADENYWNSFIAEYPTAAESISELSLIVSDDTAVQQLPDHLANILSEAFGIYCSVAFMEESEFEKALSQGKFDFAIDGIKPDFNLAEQYFYEINDRIAMTDSQTAALLANAALAQDITQKKSLIRTAEEKYISEGYAIPLYYRSEYFVQRDGCENIYYDPFTKTMYFKYAKLF